MTKVKIVRPPTPSAYVTLSDETGKVCVQVMEHEIQVSIRRVARSYSSLGGDESFLMTREQWDEIATAVRLLCAS